MIKYSYLGLLGSIIIIVIFINLYGNNLVINLSSSMPRGIYIKQAGKINRGDIVLVCLSEPYKQLGLTRDYLVRGKTCQGSDPLIKKVIAVPNDNVILTDSFIMVNSQKYFYKTFYFDSKGRKLAVYPRGNYLHTKGYWLIGTNSAKSWDSRYWGAVSNIALLSKMKLLVQFFSTKILIDGMSPTSWQSCNRFMPASKLKIFPTMVFS